ncbi:hypothetical protein FKM82_020173 [Ascaphus truei]
MYLESAQSLGARQARWSLFFSRFSYIISFIPGSKNLKADALSRQFLVEDRIEARSETILPSKLIISANTFDILDDILRDQTNIPRVWRSRTVVSLPHHPFS